MLARLVQRCSLVEGGSLPGSMMGPMTPPSNRIVRPGQCRPCASVAASSGMPTPANTTWPSFRSRELITASSSLAVYGSSLLIGDAPAMPRRLEQIAESEQVKVIDPRLRAVDVAIEVLGHPVDGVLVDERSIVIQVPEQGLVDAAALMRGAAERNLHDRLDREERNLGLIRGAPDLVVGHDALRRQNHPIRSHRKIDIHELQTVDLCVPIGIAALDVDDRDIGVECRHEQQLF